MAKSAKVERPLSPHLGIYRPQITSVLSIMHRLSGIALTAGSLLLVYWLTSLSSGEAAYNSAMGFIASWFGYLIMFAFSVAAYYHLCNGIRHLYWNTGRGFEMKSVYTSGWVVLIATAILTVVTWISVALA